MRRFNKEQRKYLELIAASCQMMHEFADILNAKMVSDEEIGEWLAMRFDDKEWLKFQGIRVVKGEEG